MTHLRIFRRDGPRRPDGIGSPPKGVMLDTAERIAQQAAAIRMQSVLTHAMPPNNLTEMTPAERRVLAAWLNGPR